MPTHALHTPVPDVTSTTVEIEDTPTVRRRTPLTRLLALLAVIVAVVSLGACTAPNSSTKGAQIASLARTHLGARYVYGAAGPSTFDCSGLTQYVHRQAGLSIPRTVAAQRSSARWVSQSSKQPGDLIFFGTYHVGIYVGSGQIIDAPKTGDVVKQRAIWTSAYTVGRYW